MNKYIFFKKNLYNIKEKLTDSLNFHSDAPEIRLPGLFHFYITSVDREPQFSNGKLRHTPGFLFM